MICELLRFSSGAASCPDVATHQVDTQLAGDRDVSRGGSGTRTSYQMCETHAGGAKRGQHRSPAVPGEVVTVTPAVSS